MRARDRHTIETLGVSAELLMESAGRAVAEAVLRERAGRGGGVLVVCGGGNNGGDGLVAARHLAAVGVPVRVAWVGDPRRLSAESSANRERARRLGIRIEGAALRPQGASLIVDALFGTGLARPVEGAAAAAIRRMRAARPRARVVAVDLPSGVDADTGQPWGVAVAADVTVTLGLPKLGLALEPGRGLAGRIVVARIGIADEAPGAPPEAALWTAAAAAATLPVRPADGHKGRFGHVLVAAGSRGKTGAAALAAQGAARIGAGLVTIACPAGVNEILEVKCTEPMTAPLPDTPDGAFAAGALAPLLALARERDVTALGPGIGRDDETQKLVRDALGRLAHPLVLDADGLFPFEPAAGRRAGARASLAGLKARKAATILTPHPGEAARLLGTRADEVNRDRVTAARRLAETSGAVVLLKGAASVVAAPDGRVVVNPTGGPELGAGGTGDVLTGVVAGLVGQGLPAFEAAALAAWIHGRAGDRLGERCGAAGVLASEVADELPAVIAELAAVREVEADGLAVPFP
jgi:NAD(P)H-hydrate epimerase